MRLDVRNRQDSPLEDTYPREKLGASEEIVHLAIGDVLPADSPRSAAVDRRHVQLLAEADVALPPILVNRATMRVIDGMHRLRAAELRDAETIAAQLLDCTEHEAFVLAVKCNIAHGLPLTLADRKAAARRLLAAEPHRSDRAVGAITGLSHKTVGAIRRRASGEIPHSDTRLGRDGRIRAVGGASAKRDPRPTADAPDQGESADGGPGDGRESDRQREQLMVLLRDPSLKLSETGRALLRLLTTRAVSPDDWKGILGGVPPHCNSAVVELASQYAKTWQQFTDELKVHASATD